MIAPLGAPWKVTLLIDRTCAVQTHTWTIGWSPLDRALTSLTARQPQLSRAGVTHLQRIE